MHKKLSYKQILGTSIAFMAVLIFIFVLIVVDVMFASHTQVVQQVSLGGPDKTLAVSEDAKKDLQAKKVQLPQFYELMGKNTEEILQVLGHGAQVTAQQNVSDGGAVLQLVTVLLTQEASDETSGVPTVELGLNNRGVCIKLSYSIASDLLGYPAVSLSEALNQEQFIPKAFAEAGVHINQEDFELPTDRLSYTSFERDGKTAKEETLSFSGLIQHASSNYVWDATINFDYRLANSTGNLANTIRTLTLSLTKKS